jgi:hypothetical protein
LQHDAHAFAQKALLHPIGNLVLSRVQFLGCENTLFRQRFDQGVKESGRLQSPAGVGVGAAVGVHETTNDLLPKLLQGDGYLTRSIVRDGLSIEIVVCAQ